MSSILNKSSKHAFHIEICQRSNSVESGANIVRAMERSLLKISEEFVENHSKNLHRAIIDDTYLSQHVKSVKFLDTCGNEFVLEEPIKVGEAKMNIYVYRVFEEQPENEMLEHDEEDLPAATHWMLPSTMFEDLWESLIFDSSIKESLLNYTNSSLYFSDQGVNDKLITWNRVVLLHGPPGTGKTSLCRALAHKLAIRLSGRFRKASLLEVNSHSLFSKWFSESGKLVMKMFQKVESLVADEDHLVCLLVDEVESLTAARSSVAAGTEPSDAIRVVNAVLTRLDQLKQYKNVLILTTSNVTGKIDAAFIDRADIKFYIGPPSPEAIYAILRSCIMELCRAHVVISRVEILARTPSDIATLSLPLSQKLWEISQEAYGLSGRALRKLPFLAHAQSIQTFKNTSLENFLHALSNSVKVMLAEVDQLSNDK